MVDNWMPNLDTKVAVEGFLSTLLLTLPDLIGIDEIISGCRVIAVDPYGVGVATYPRYMRIALRDEYYNDVWYRGNIALAVDDFCTVVHIKDGDRYEIVWTSGSTGSDVIVVLPDHAHAGVAGDGGQLDWDDVWLDAVHNHTVAGEGGQLDHGAALIGLGDDDHPQYLLADGSRALTGHLTTRNLIPDFDARTLGDATHTYDLYCEVVAHYGATGSNFMVLPDNLADGLHVADLGTLADHYLSFVSTNAQREVVINQNAADIDFRVEDDAGNNVINVRASDGHISLGRGSPGSYLVQVVNTGATIAAAYINFYSYPEKTAGAGSANFYSIYAAINLNQVGGTVADMAGLYGRAYLFNGTVNSDLFGCYFMVDINGGTVDDDAFGQLIFVDMDGGTVSGDLIGLCIQTDFDAGTVTGSVINTLVDVRTGNDYGIYQDGGVIMNYFEGDISANDITDRSPFFSGDGVAAIKRIKAKAASKARTDWGLIDHDTLPEGVVGAVAYRRWFKKSNDKPMPVGWAPPGTDDERDKYYREIVYLPSRSLGGQISVNVRALAQLIARVEMLEAMVGSS
jgi:hypothetical protein